MKLLKDQTPVESRNIYIYNERIIEQFVPAKFEKNPESFNIVKEALKELKSEISKHNKFENLDFKPEDEDILKFKLETQSA